jgi:hypothetical protein
MLSKKTKQDKQTLIEKQIKDITDQMASVTADSPEYAKMVTALQELYKIKDPNVRERTTLKDWIPVIASIGGILVIIAYEQAGHSLTSKAVSFIRKA